MADTPALPIQSYVAPFGAILVSTFLASIYGITVLQTFLYYHKYSYDHLRWKILVATVFALDTVALGLLMRTMYYYLVESWGTPEMTTIEIKPFAAEYIVTAFLTFIVQCFYINTVRALCAPVIVPIVLLALAVTSLATALILPGVQLHLHFVVAITHSRLNYIASNISRSTALAVDVGVVVTLCLQLRRRTARQAPGSRAVFVLVAFALQRGILQVILRAGELLAYAIRSGGTYFLPVLHVMTSRVYCTSLLATLITRDYVLSQAERAGMPGTFSSVLDPPQLSTVEWERGAQHVTLMLPERSRYRTDNGDKHPQSTASNNETTSWAASGLKTV